MCLLVSPLTDRVHIPFEGLALLATFCPLYQALEFYLFGLPSAVL